MSTFAMPCSFPQCWALVLGCIWSASPSSPGTLPCAHYKISHVHVMSQQLLISQYDAISKNQGQKVSFQPVNSPASIPFKTHKKESRLYVVSHSFCQEIKFFIQTDSGLGTEVKENGSSPSHGVPLSFHCDVSQESFSSFFFFFQKAVK